MLPITLRFHRARQNWLGIKDILTRGTAYKFDGIRTRREIPVLDLALQKSFNDQELSVVVNALAIDSRVTVNDSNPA